jgi:hypothetical protein
MLAEPEEVAEYVLDSARLEALPRGFYARRSDTDLLIESIRGKPDDGKPSFACLANVQPETLKVPRSAWDRYAKDAGVVLSQ